MQYECWLKTVDTDRMINFHSFAPPIALLVHKESNKRRIDEGGQIYG